MTYLNADHCFPRSMLLTDEAATSVWRDARVLAPRKNQISEKFLCRLIGPGPGVAYEVCSYDEVCSGEVERISDGPWTITAWALINRFNT